MSDCDDRSEWQQHVGVGEPQHVSRPELRQPRKRELINDSTGRVGGYQIDHPDGRVDAMATPSVARAGAKTQEVGS